MISLVLATMILTMLSFSTFSWLFPPSLISVHPPISPIGVISSQNGEVIGISDGTFVFDTNRIDGQLKSLAANDLKQNNVASATSLFTQAIAEDSNDAEAAIYLEDQRVLASSSPYITLVVATTLTGSVITAGRDNLQGAYVAQKEYNDGLKLNGGVEVRLLIANTGDNVANAPLIAQRIVRVAQADRTVKGVMGEPFSSFDLTAIPILSQAHIPMVSPTASSDLLTGLSPFFFRVVPSNEGQAIAGARYAEQQLHAKKVALFVDSTNAYSMELSNDFSRKFAADGNQIITVVHYLIGRSEVLPALLQDALSHNPDLIYFAGYSDDASILLTDLPTTGPFANLQVLGGDALYALGGYPSSARANLNRLHFTAFAYPDEWDYQNLGAQKPAFFTIYGQDFDPNQKHTNSPYGYLRPDIDTTLSYDAMSVLLQGCNNALAGGNNTLTLDRLRQSLAEITGSHAIQGVSGQISFGPDGDPTNKAIVVLSVDSYARIKISGIQGCFLVGKCSNS